MASHPTTMLRITELKEQIDADIARFATDLVAQTSSQYGEHPQEAMKAVCHLLTRGGKRLRGNLVLTAYEMTGGKDKPVALQLARILELIHVCLLIYDDICDRSAIRRGGPTVHKILERYHRTEKMHGDSAHFGLSQALNAALIASHLAQAEIAKLPLDHTIKVMLYQQLNEALMITGYGQMNDIFNEALQDVSEKDVKQMLMQKTAYYSFWNPLAMGALAAGEEAWRLECLHDYSEQAGLSFQITDDILGTFGNTFESGKSATDDMREGKVTLMVAHALRVGSPDQKRHILSVLGNPEMAQEDFDDIKLILENTGSRQYAEQVAKQSAEKAVMALRDAPTEWDQHRVNYLRELATLMITRTT